MKWFLLFPLMAYIFAIWLYLDAEDGWHWTKIARNLRSMYLNQHYWDSRLKSETTKPWAKITPRRRRLKRQRAYARLRDYVLLGKIPVSEELMRFVRSPKWKRKIAEAAIYRMCDREGAKQRARWPQGYRSASEEK